MKKLPIGISDFKKLISEDFYYVDKTLFIKEILASGAESTLIPRPRRFGKTLNLSMLRYFFEKTEESISNLFKDLKIGQDPKCMKHQGQYPVIFLTFKDVKQRDWESCYEKITKLIGEEFEHHRYLIDDNFLTSRKRADFQAVLDGTASQVTYENALKDLSAYLATYHNKRPIILIDEYDAPIHSGFFNKHYKDIINFMRGFLCAGMKDNSNLEFSVMTGILRVAKESIFSGINNLKVCSLLNPSYANTFGLTEKEVLETIKYYKLSNSIDNIRSWFNGYNMGDGTHVYNPWSIINCVDQKGILQPYWINTSDNQLIKELIQHGGNELKENIELLIERKSIRERISETIVFSDLSSMTSAVWNFMLFTGYLTFKNFSLEGKRWYADLLIPNDEVEEFFQLTILSWFERGLGIKSFENMLKSLVSGDTSSFKRIFKNFVKSSFSYFDVSGQEPEKFYHAFVLGMLVNLGSEYEVKSNRESGYGRYDVMIIPKDTTKLGIVIEFKKTYSDEGETLEQAAAAALKQINDKQYTQELHTRSIKETLKLGIVFEGKKVLIVEEK